MVSSKKWIIITFLLSIIIFYFTPSFNATFTNMTFWTFRDGMLYFTGVVAVLLMILAMVLSIRLNIIEKKTNGLDKSYFLHKWIGISAFIMMVIHWAFKECKGIILDFNLLEKPEKKSSPSTLTDFQVDLFHLGNDIVEYVFYIMVAILLIALIIKIPYHIFKYSHKVIPFLFLLIAFHGYTIQIRGHWFNSFGSILLNIILTFGVIISLYILFQRNGKKHQYEGIITETKFMENIHSLYVTIKLNSDNFSYKAGQYVFLKFQHSREFHPFSICSYNKNLNEISFLIKELGDYTNILKHKIQESQNVIVEGPYGNFDFNDNKENQIWISAGAGITPFMAMVDYLVDNKTNKHIDFYFSNKGECNIKNILEEKCKTANINFHFINTLVDKRLNIEDIVKNIDKNNTSIWFCGPKPFCNNIISLLKKYSYPIKNLHFDYFNMR